MIREIKKILTALDNYLFDHIHPYIDNVNTSIMVIFSFFASQKFLLPANVLLIFYFLTIKKDKWAAIKVTVVSLGNFVLTSSLKYYFRRVRPIHPVHEAALGYSFPSGHAMSAMTFYGLIIYLIISKLKYIRLKIFFISFLCLLILVIGFSRIYLRVHYASDVLGGFAIGYLWLFISLWTLNKFEKKSLYEKTM